jgi:hypothetical protein
MRVAIARRPGYTRTCAQMRYYLESAQVGTAVAD